MRNLNTCSTVNRVEVDQDSPSTVPSPEEVAGRELRRLRLERGWSQEQVARRMAAQGFDSWHQTTVGKTETAQRPLRLNEAVALSGLFGIPLARLLTPLTVRVGEIDEEIAVTTQKREENLAVPGRIEARRAQAQSDLRDTTAEYDNVARALEWAESYIEILRARRHMAEGKDVPADVALRAAIDSIPERGK